MQSIISRLHPSEAINVHDVGNLNVTSELNNRLNVDEGLNHPSVVETPANALLFNPEKG